MRVGECIGHLLPGLSDGLNVMGRGREEPQLASALLWGLF